MILDYFTGIAYESVEQRWAYTHEADGRLTAGSRDFSKPWDLNFQSDMIIIFLNFAASRLLQICR